MLLRLHCENYITDCGAAGICNGAMEAIRRDGAIIVRRPADRVSGLTVYDRYVSSAASCNADEVAVLQEIKAVDVSMCAFFVCKHAPMGNR